MWEMLAIEQPCASKIFEGRVVKHRRLPGNILFANDSCRHLSNHFFGSVSASSIRGSNKKSVARFNFLVQFQRNISRFHGCCYLAATSVWQQHGARS